MQPNNEDHDETKQENMPGAPLFTPDNPSTTTDADTTTPVDPPNDEAVTGTPVAESPLAAGPQQTDPSIEDNQAITSDQNGSSTTPVTSVDGDPAAPTVTGPAVPEAPAATPSATPVVPLAAAVVPPSRGRVSKKVMTVIIAAIVLVLLAAGAAGAYFGIYLPNQPQKIIGDGLSTTINSDKLKTTGFEGEVQLSGGDAAKSVSSIGFEGKIDSVAKAGEASVSVNTAVTTIKLDARFPGSDNLYLKLSGLNGLDKLLASAGASGQSSSTYGMYASFISQLNDQWFFVNKSLISQYAPSAASMESGNSKISEADAKKLGDIYKNNQFIRVDQKLADETINGIASYHMKASIDKDKLKSFMEAVKAANINGVKLEQKDIDEVAKVDFSKYPFEIWIGKKDRFVTQLKTVFTEKSTTYSVRIALKNINKPVSVEEPANAKSIMDLFGGMMGNQDSVLGLSTDAVSPARLLGNVQ